MADGSVLQWFPGHMAKTRRELREEIKKVDLVAELLDARIPDSSLNPEIEKIVGEKPRLKLLNKSDLADPNGNAKWLSYYQRQGLPAMLMDCQSGRGVGEIPAKVRELLQEKLERDARRGMNRALRLMVVGIPNVGKSSLINRLSGGRKTKVEDRPGVTRSTQWIRLQSGLELLDTPGVLWPKFEERIGLNLAFTGAIKDDVFDVEWVAQKLLSRLAHLYPQKLAERYKLETVEKTGRELLWDVGKKRGYLVSGGEIDTLRAANAVLDDFRGGRIGRITLERPVE